VTVGILRGLLELGVDVRLVHYDARRHTLKQFSMAALPPAVLAHLPIGASPQHGRDTQESPSALGSAEKQSAAVRPSQQAPHSRSRAIRKMIFGATPAAEDLRLSFRQFKGATQQLVSSVYRWAGGKPASLALGKSNRLSAHPKTLPLPAEASGKCLAPGDILLCLGATWTLSHVEATSALRQQGIRVIRMIYDLIPTLKPQWVSKNHVQKITSWVRSVLTESEHVLTISEFSKKEIVQYCTECRFPAPALSIVRLGDVIDSTNATGLPSPLPRFVPKRPFFLCVSTLDVRKNQRILYDVWSLLAGLDPAHCPDLLCVGTPHPVVDFIHEMIADRSVNRHIHLLQGIEDWELQWYYKNCLATIYPSKYEGWGLPVAESLAFGRLCLASNATSMPEISCDLPEFFEPHDAAKLLELVRRVVADPDWVKQREKIIRESFKPTAWKQTAEQVLLVIQSAIASVPPAAAKRQEREPSAPCDGKR